MDYTALYRQIRSELGMKRRAHSDSVVRVMERLAVRFALPFEAARFAGIGHDLAREWKDDDIRKLVRDDGTFTMSEEEKKQPMLMHGAAAAILIRDMLPDEFPHTNAVMLAIRWHTVGSLAMGSLGYALFVSDYIEELRVHISPSRKRYIEELESLELMVLQILRNQIAYLESRDITVHTETRELIAHLEQVSGGDSP